MNRAFGPKRWPSSGDARRNQGHFGAQCSMSKKENITNRVWSSLITDAMGEYHHESRLQHHVHGHVFVFTAQCQDSLFPGNPPTNVVVELPPHGLAGLQRRQARWPPPFVAVADQILDDVSRAPVVHQRSTNRWLQQTKFIQKTHFIRKEKTCWIRREPFPQYRIFCNNPVNTINVIYRRYSPA